MYETLAISPSPIIVILTYSVPHQLPVDQGETLELKRNIPTCLIINMVIRWYMMVQSKHNY